MGIQKWFSGGSEAPPNAQEVEEIKNRVADESVITTGNKDDLDSPENIKRKVEGKQAIEEAKQEPKETRLKKLEQEVVDWIDETEDILEKKIDHAVIDAMDEFGGSGAEKEGMNMSGGDFDKNRNRVGLSGEPIAENFKSFMRHKNER